MTGVEPYRVNSTNNNLASIGDINPGTGSSNAGNFLILGEDTIFSADNGTDGLEPYYTSLTPGALRQLKNISPGATSSNPSNFTAVGPTLLFSAFDQTTAKYSIWKTNATSDTTVKVVDINGVPTLSARLLNKMVFVQDIPGSGDGIWVSDGTSAGTFELNDLLPGLQGATITDLNALGASKIVFYANSINFGREPWVTDGTTAGTGLLKNLVTGDGSSKPITLANSSSKVFFSGFGGSVASPTYSIYETDGSTAGTTDRIPLALTGETDSSLISGITPLDSKVVFSADNGILGSEPWVSDGTEAGTTLLKDILSGIFFKRFDSLDSKQWRSLFSRYNTFGGCRTLYYLWYHGGNATGVGT